MSPSGPACNLACFKGLVDQAEARYGNELLKRRSDATPPSPEEVLLGATWATMAKELERRLDDNWILSKRTGPVGDRPVSNPADPISSGYSVPDQSEEADGGPLDFIYNEVMDAVCGNSYQCANQQVEDRSGTDARD